MRNLMISVGQYQFYDEPYNKGLIGGKIVAINPDTGEQQSYPYKRFHTGKTNKFEVLAKIIYLLEPPEENKDDENEKEDLTE